MNIIMLPEVKKYDAICEITTSGQAVEVILPEKIESFRLMVKQAGFIWSNKRWFSAVDITGKAEFVASKALQMGIRVIAPDAVREAVKAGNIYERWVYRGGKHFWLRWWDGDWYKKCRELPGSRWKKPFVSVPIIYRDEIADFAKINGFGLSPGAIEEINKTVETEVIKPVMKHGEEIEPVIGNGIAQSLRDE